MKTSLSNNNVTAKAVEVIETASIDTPEKSSVAPAKKPSKAVENILRNDSPRKVAATSPMENAPTQSKEADRRAPIMRVGNHQNQSSMPTICSICFRMIMRHPRSGRHHVQHNRRSKLPMTRSKMTTTKLKSIKRAFASQMVTLILWKNVNQYAHKSKFRKSRATRG